MTKYTDNKPVAPKYLPNKPSKLILRALEDLEEVEGNPKYTIDMSTYHMPITDDRGVRVVSCSVCFAGAVIAEENPNSACLEPGHFPKKIADKLKALDLFRQGDVLAALLQMDAHASLQLVHHLTAQPPHVTKYRADSKPDQYRFKADMLDMVTMLEENGL